MSLIFDEVLNYYRHELPLVRIRALSSRVTTCGGSVIREILLRRVLDNLSYGSLQLGNYLRSPVVDGEQQHSVKLQG